MKFQELPKSIKQQISMEKCTREARTCHGLVRQVTTLSKVRGTIRFCIHHPSARAFCNLPRLWNLHIAREYLKKQLAKKIGLLRPDPIPHRSAWECIHRHEGSWTDPGSPYYGGLQMDLGFQQTYGLALYRAKGTADHWTPEEQMLVAEVAYKTRGFWPWPNTARYCGLL